MKALQVLTGCLQGLRQVKVSVSFHDRFYMGFHGGFRVDLDGGLGCCFSGLGCIGFQASLSGVRNGISGFVPDVGRSRLSRIWMFLGFRSSEFRV